MAMRSVSIFGSYSFAKRIISILAPPFLKVVTNVIIIIIIKIFSDCDKSMKCKKIERCCGVVYIVIRRSELSELSEIKKNDVNDSNRIVGS